MKPITKIIALSAGITLISIGVLLERVTTSLSIACTLIGAIVVTMLTVVTLLQWFELLDENVEEKQQPKQVKEDEEKDEEDDVVDAEDALNDILTKMTISRPETNPILNTADKAIAHQLANHGVEVTPRQVAVSRRVALNEIRKEAKQRFNTLLPNDDMHLLRLLYTMHNDGQIMQRKTERGTELSLPEYVDPDEL